MKLPRLIATDLDGYVWGVKWQALYPGMSLAQESPAADTWSAQLDLPFYEVHIRTNGHNLALVFSDLVVTAIEPGHAAFVVVPPTGPDFKFPWCNALICRCRLPCGTRRYSVPMKSAALELLSC